MSRRSRANRNAKQNKRRREAAGRHRPGANPGPHGTPRHERIAVALREAAMCRAHDAQRHATDLLEEFELPDSARDFELATQAVVVGAIRGAWEAGWSPSDVHEFARRNLEPLAVEYLAGAIVGESEQYSVATLHPRWRADLAAIAAGVTADSHGQRIGRWATVNADDHRVALIVVLQVLALLATLPRLEPLLPLPGAGRHAVVAAGQVDEKVLGKVRALLAKAEGTEFPEEAEAFSAKAQDLMSRYSLHQAVADYDRSASPMAAGRRIWLANPYAGAKALLVQAVATANRCRAVWTKDLGFITVIGFDTDLNLIELLTTSLLVQANRAMLSAGRQVGGRTRTKSYRHSFLVAYATRIGERLDTTNAKVTSEVADSRLLPVLAARSQAADDLAGRLFPAMVQRRVSVSDGAGWGAGRAAADLALLDVREALAG